MQEQVENRNGKSSSRLLLSGIALAILAGIACHFWPAARGRAGGDGQVSLTGISYTEDNPLAMVEGRIAREGDVIEGVTVLEIQRDKVEFERLGRRWTQEMPPAQEGVSSGLPMLVQLGSDSCPPCRQMKPILKKLRGQYKGKFRIIYIDVWNNRAAALKYGVGAIPTQIFYDAKGREVFRHVGFYSKQDILAAWKELGVRL